MSRLDRDALLAVAQEKLEVEPDETGLYDLVGPGGSVIIAAEPDDMKQAFKRIKKVKAGYRWVIINRQDLFAANSLSIGSKAGIMDGAGSILKNADIPRRKV